MRKGRKITALLLSLAMMATMSVSSPLVSFASDAQPAVKIGVSNIKGTPDTVEVSIVMAEEQNFKSAGAVLQYDASKIQPITWSSGDAITVPTNSDAQAGWKSAAIIESKGPDGIAGKPATAFQGDANTGYLYLGAESAKAQTLKADTKVVTVRFGYIGSATSADLAGLVKFPENNDAGNKAAFYSPVKAHMLYQTEIGDVSKFYYTNPLVMNTDNGSIAPDDDTTSDGGISGGDDPTPTPTPNPDDETVDQGSGNTDDFVSLTFYDWDGTTLLGTRIVKKGESLNDPNLGVTNSALTTQAALSDTELAAMGYAPIAQIGNTINGSATDVNGNAMSAINKNGYAFAGWTLIGNNSTPNDNLSDRTLQAFDPTQIFSLENITQSAILRAAYDETGISTAAPAASRRYKITYSPFRATEDNSGLQTTFTVTRDKTARRSNTDLNLVISIRPSGLGDTRLTIPIGSVDLENYVFQLPSNASSVYDAGGAITYSVEDGAGGTRAAGSSSIPAGDIVKN